MFFLPTTTTWPARGDGYESHPIFPQRPHSPPTSPRLFYNPSRSDLMNHNRRKILTQQENQIPDFDPELQYFARVVGCRSGDIFDVEFLKTSGPDGASVAATATEADLIPTAVRMPAKFKHVIWAKTGDLVILSHEDIEFSSRTAMFISSILAPHHIKYFMQQRQLPVVLIPEKFAHKSYARHDTIQTTHANERFLGGDDDGEGEDEDDMPEEINNYKKRPFMDSSSSDEDID